MILLFLFFTAFLHGEASEEKALPLIERQALPIAPLIPLEPQYPLGLSESNKQILYSPQAIEQEAHKNARLFAKRTFPFFPFMLLTMASGISYWGYLWVQKQRQARPIIKISPLEKAMQKLESLKKMKGKEQPGQLKSILVHYLEEQYGARLQPYTPLEIKGRLPLQEPQNEALVNQLNRLDYFIYSNQEIILEDEIDKVAAFIQEGA